MEFTFVLDTHGTCVPQLRDEFVPLEERAQAWTFPYGIVIALRVLPESYGRKTFRRFNSKERVLYLDVSISYEQYMRMSKHEQREALGLQLDQYLSESLAKYPKHADKSARETLLMQVREWMEANDWLNGRLQRARELLGQDIELHEISKQLDLPLVEVEHLLLRMHHAGEPSDIHPDNVAAGGQLS